VPRIQKERKRRRRKGGAKLQWVALQDVRDGARSAAACIATPRKSGHAVGRETEEMALKKTVEKRIFHFLHSYPVFSRWLYGSHVIRSSCV